MRGIKKRLVSVLLTVSLLVGAVLGSYETVQAEALVAFGTSEFLTSLFMTCGFVAGLDLLTKPQSDIDDFQHKLDQWMKSDYERVYEKYLASYPDLPPEVSPTPIPTSTPGITPVPTSAPEISPPMLSR